MADEGLDVTYVEFIDDFREVIRLMRSLRNDLEATKKTVDDLCKSNAALRIENNIRDIRLENNDEDWRKLERKVDNLAESIAHSKVSEDTESQPTTKGVRLE